MLIGVFFSEIGASLLARLSAGDPDAQRVCIELAGAHHKTDAEFRNICKRLSIREYVTEMNREELEEIKVLLAGGRALFMQLMENPMLLEHESFTDCRISRPSISRKLVHVFLNGPVFSGHSSNSNL